jgi:hypothetical protein
MGNFVSTLRSTKKRNLPKLFRQKPHCSSPLSSLSVVWDIVVEDVFYCFVIGAGDPSHKSIQNMVSTMHNHVNKQTNSYLYIFTWSINQKINSIFMNVHIQRNC